MYSNVCPLLSIFSDLNYTRAIPEDFATTSLSSVSTTPSLSDDEFPVFQQNQKVHFVNVETVASSSVRYHCVLYLCFSKSANL